MPVAADILYRYSGGAGNTDPSASLGGVMSTAGGGTIDDNVLHDLFDLVTGAERAAGDVEYRGFYIHNSHGSETLIGAVIWISTDNAEIDIALADEAVGATMETIANESTAPVGPVFTHPTTEAGGLVIGDIPAGSRKGIWIRRTIAQGSSSIPNDTVSLSVAGDSE